MHYLYSSHCEGEREIRISNSVSMILKAMQNLIFAEEKYFQTLFQKNNTIRTCVCEQELRKAKQYSRESNSDTARSLLKVSTLRLFPRRPRSISFNVSLQPRAKLMHELFKSISIVSGKIAVSVSTAKCS